MKLFAVSIATVALLTGCVTTKEWAATGGSRADGVIRLSYEVSAFQTAKVDEQQALNIATKRCQTWGYTGAEAFGGVTRQCNAPGGLSGCAQFLVTKEFQCTGNAAAPAN